MNILIRVLQILLALWNITGGIYMIMNYPELITEWANGVFPSFFWIILGTVQILFSLGLSIGKGPLRSLAPISAMGLAIISLLGIPFYTSYAGFPGMLWGLIPAVLLAFVAYWRGSEE